MQNRTPILVALVIGIAAALLTSMYIDDIRRSSLPATKLIMVAAHDLTAGSTLEAKDVTAAQRDLRSLPKLSIGWDERNLYLGQQLAFDVAESDYILQPYFGSQSAGVQRPSDRIDAKLNQRAMTIPVTTETSLEESIRQGDRIDLLLTYTDRSSPAAPLRAGTTTAPTARTVTVPLLDNMYVLFTGKFASPPGTPYSTITLLVSVDEAKLLTWALTLGKLTIVLRNSKDLQIPDRTFIAGDDSTLSALSRQQLRIEDVIAGRQQK
jgi:Flp pilus assembly protein CpaB